VRLHRHFVQLLLHASLCTLLERLTCGSTTVTCKRHLGAFCRLMPLGSSFRGDILSHSRLCKQQPCSSPVDNLSVAAYPNVDHDRKESGFNKLLKLTKYFFSRICAERIIVLSRRIGTMFGYNPNETDSRWRQAGKPAAYNPKQKLLHELLTSHATTT
jgi:hypothetical protein